MRYFFILFILILLFSCREDELLKKFSVKTDVFLPKTNKKFNISFKPYILYKNQKIIPILNEFRNYFGKNYSDDLKNSYKLEINFTNFGYQFLKLQNDANTCIVLINCPTKIYSPQGKVLLEINITVRNEKQVNGDKDKILEELTNKSYNDYLMCLNENINFKSFLSSDNFSKNVKDESMEIKNLLKPYNNLFEKNKKDYRLFFSHNQEISYGNYFSILLNSIKFRAFFNICFEFYPIEYFSIEYKFDVYNLILGNILNNLFGMGSSGSFSFYHEISFNINNHFTPFFCPNINLYIGHFFTLIGGTNYNYSFFTINDNYPIINGNNYRQITYNSLKIGIGLLISDFNFYLRKSNYSYGISIYYNPIYSEYYNNVIHCIGFDFTVKAKYNSYIYRNKPFKIIKNDNFRIY